MLEMATALYNMAADMDYSDYSDMADNDIMQLATDLEKIGKDSALYRCLEMIAHI